MLYPNTQSAIRSSQLITVDREVKQLRQINQTTASHVKAILFRRKRSGLSQPDSVIVYIFKLHSTVIQTALQAGTGINE